MISLSAHSKGFVDQIVISQIVITKLKPHFVRMGIPNAVVSDKGPQFTSDEFARFSKKWGFEHITTSPYHSRSNVKVESLVYIYIYIYIQ